MTKIEGGPSFRISMNQESSARLSETMESGLVTIVATRALAQSSEKHSMQLKDNQDDSIDMADPTFRKRRITLKKPKDPSKEDPKAKKAFQGTFSRYFNNP